MSNCIIYGAAGQNEKRTGIKTESFVSIGHANMAASIWLKCTSHKYARKPLTQLPTQGPAAPGGVGVAEVHATSVK